LIRVVVRQTNFNKIATRSRRWAITNREIIYENAGIAEVDPRDETAIAKLNAERSPQFVTYETSRSCSDSGVRLLSTRLHPRHPILLKDMLGHRTRENDEARMTNDEKSPNEQMTKSGSDFVIPSSLDIGHSSFLATLLVAIDEHRLVVMRWNW